MEENLKIFEEKFAECRLCNHLVSSSNPMCGKCGLETSSEGIIELAELEESVEDAERQGFWGIYSLRILAIISFVMILFGALFLSLGLSSIFKLYYWTGFFLYALAYFAWDKKYLRTTFGIEETELIAREKRISLIIFISSIILGTIIYIFS